RRRQIHRHRRELTRSAALKEQHFVARRYSQNLAQHRFGFFSTGDEGFAAMADFHDGHAGALPVEQLLTSLLQDFKGQRGWPRGEIENAHEKYPSGEVIRERAILAAKDWVSCP